MIEQNISSNVNISDWDGAGEASTPPPSEDQKPPVISTKKEPPAYPPGEPESISGPRCLRLIKIRLRPRATLKYVKRIVLILSGSTRKSRGAMASADRGQRPSHLPEM